MASGQDPLPEASFTGIAPGIPAAPAAKPAPKPRHHGAAAIVFLLAVASMLFLGWWLLRRHKAADAAAAAALKAGNAPIVVTVATATRGSVGVYLTAIGTVTPVYTDAIGAQVSGVITAVSYREGQIVQAGDALVEIDPRAYQAQLDQAEGALARDQALLAQAQMDWQRYQQAWADNAIPHQQLEDQQQLVAQAQGTVKTDQGQVQYDTVELGYCHITAPIGGRVGLRLVDPGNLVAANGGATLVTIAQLQPTTVVFTLAEDSLGEVAAQMALGATLPVDAWDRQNAKKIASGALITLDNQIDTTTGTVKARASFANADGKLFPNQFVNTRLKVKTLVNQTLVPASAIQQNGDVAFVYAIQGGKAVLAKVTAGVSENGLTAVVGLAAGAVVANSSFDKLQNGAPVTLATAAAPAPAGAGTP